MPVHQNGLFEDTVLTRPAEGETFAVPLLIVGGSTAAYSAMLAALQSQIQVCVVQPQAVVGGQFTAQGLPASDDGRLMVTPSSSETVAGESFCISISQRKFRDRQRELQPVQDQVVDNPGGGWVGPLCTTPVVAATAMNEAIAPFLEQGQLILIPYSDPIAVVKTEPSEGLPRVTQVTFRDRQTRHSFSVTADLILEATDLGDVLELGDIPSRVGQEARQETGEAALPETAHPECQQAITFDIVVEKLADANRAFSVKQPEKYGTVQWLQPKDFHSTHWSIGRQIQTWNFFDDYGIFRYRRISRVKTGPGGSQAPVNKQVNVGDITVLNWGIHNNPVTKERYVGNDYVYGVLVGVTEAERQQHIQNARDRAQGYLHFLQSQFPNLKPRGDLTWTEDGIALEPYLREARRGIALTTILHQHVAKSFFPDGYARAHTFTDTIGIGQYHYLDFHPNQDTPPGTPSNHVQLVGDDHVSLPFTVPLGSLIPQSTDGLILSAKSIGTTHITNAAYRMHPVEWAIGEAGGHLAAFALERQVTPREVATNRAWLRTFQGRLAQQGIPLVWFDDVAHDDPDFEAIQVVAAAGIVRSESHLDLHFRPSNPVSRAVVATAIVNLLGFELINPSRPRFWDVPRSHWAYRAIETLAKQNIVAGVGYGRFAPDRSMNRLHLSYMVINALPKSVDLAFANTPRDAKLLQRRELSRVLYAMLKVKLDIVPHETIA